MAFHIWTVNFIFSAKLLHFFGLKNITSDFSFFCSVNWALDFWISSSVPFPLAALFYRNKAFMCVCLGYFSSVVFPRASFAWQIAIKKCFQAPQNMQHTLSTCTLHLMCVCVCQSIDVNLSVCVRVPHKLC